MNRSLRERRPRDSSAAIGPPSRLRALVTVLSWMLGATFRTLRSSHRCSSRCHSSHGFRPGQTEDRKQYSDCSNYHRDELGRTHRIAGNSLCTSHRHQHKRRGDPLAPPLKEPGWTSDEDRTHIRIVLRSPDPWGEAPAVADRRYPACVTRACNLRRGIKQSSAVLPAKAGTLSNPKVVFQAVTKSTHST